jgi:hypothetical protein
MSIDKGSDDSKNALSELKNIMLATVDRTNPAAVADIDPADVA